MNEIMAWLTAITAFIIPGFGEVAEPVYYGYAEADYVHVAPLSSGVITNLSVSEGDSVASGQVLFVLNISQYKASVLAAEARVAAARAGWRNLETGGREQEIEVIRASLGKARADLELAEVTLERSEKLSAGGFAPKARVDQDRAALASARAQVAQLSAQLEVAELPARNEQLVAARANLEAAEAEADRARAMLDERTVRAPAKGMIERIHYQAGEMVPAGRPVLSVLQPEEVKVRFFVPETERVQFKTGQMVFIACDGCPKGLEARLTHLASEPQYTPPVIFSREERARLVFMAEAQFAGASPLAPGQPVTVRLLP